MRIVSYGRREAALFGTAFAVVGVALLFVWPVAALVPAAGVLFVLYFFRDPARKAPEGEGLLVAPADGRVVAIERAHEPEYLGCQAVVVRIFLSIFDVHINRAPADGRVVMTRYRPGRFLSALRQSAAHHNESNLVGLVLADEGGSRLAVKQIAGVIARRIVCAVKEGDRVGRGEKIGMIKFGSLTELYVPVETPFQVTVVVGEKVRAGTTVIGRLSS